MKGILRASYVIVARFNLVKCFGCHSGTEMPMLLLVLMTSLQDLLKGVLRTSAMLGLDPLASETILRASEDALGPIIASKNVSKAFLWFKCHNHLFRPR